MKKKAFLFFVPLLVLIGTPLIAQQSTTRFFFAYAYEALTVDTTSGGVPFTSTKVVSTTNPVNSAELVQFTVECSSGTSCPFRLTLDGTAPTTTVGQLFDYGYTINIYGHANIVAFRAIRTGSTSASLRTTYYR